MSFEDSIKSLDEIIEKLDSGNLSLDEAIELYKKGIDLSASCKKQLDNAKLKITEVKTGENI